MNALEQKIIKDCKNLVNQSLQDGIISFLKSLKGSITVDKILENPSKIEEFLKSHDPKPVKTTRAAGSGSAWLGFAKKYREEHKADKPSSGDVGKAWKKEKAEIEKSDNRQEQLDQYIALANTKSPKVTKAKAEKVPGNAWLGFLAEFKAKNDAKEDNEKIDGRDLMKEASKVWNKGKDFTTDQVNNYKKMNIDAKAEKALAVEEKKKPKAKKGKGKGKEKKVAKKTKIVESSDDSDSDDNVIIESE